MNQRQLCDSRSQDRAAFEFQQLIELTLPGSLKTFNGSNSGVIRRIEAAASPQTQIVDRQIPRHREQPCIELASRIVSADLLDHSQPGLLKHIISGNGILKQSVEESIQPVLIPRHYRAQRIQFPALKSRDRVFMGTECVRIHGGRENHINGYTDFRSEKTHWGMGE